MRHQNNGARQVKLALAGLLGVIVLAGCATMSKDECLYADWRAIGFEDGAAGKEISAVSARRSACAKKAGVTVNMSEYTQGREAGLVQYCTPDRGYALGSRGGTYNGVCTGVGEDEFKAAYEEGRHLYSLKNAVNGLDADIRQAQYDLNDVEHRIAEVETQLVGPSIPGVDRAELLSELKDLLEEKNDIEITLYELGRDHSHAEQELRNYRDYMALRASNGPLQAPPPQTEF